jgi:hypothetical protein
MRPTRNVYPIERGRRLSTALIVRRSFPRQLHSLHVLVAGQAAVAVIPRNCHVPGFSCDYSAKVGRVAIETDTSAGFDFARLFRSHGALHCIGENGSWRGMGE